MISKSGSVSFQARAKKISGLAKSYPKSHSKLLPFGLKRLVASRYNIASNQSKLTNSSVAYNHVSQITFGESLHLTEHETT